MHLETIDSKSVALVVVDTENAFCRGDADLPAPGIVEAMSRLVPLVERCREAGIPVVWAIRGDIASWNRRLLDPVATLAPELEQTVAIPAHMAFGQTRLPEVLSARAANRLFVAGVAADGFLERLALESAGWRCDIASISDCLLDPSGEAKSYRLGTFDSERVLRWIDGHAEGPRTLGLAHLLLQTRDIKRAERFYVGVLGFTVRKRERFDETRPLIVTHQGLGITEGGPGDGLQVDHIAFRVHDVRGLAARIRGADVPILRELGPGAYGMTIYVADPDGNKIELFE